MSREKKSIFKEEFVSCSDLKQSEFQVETSEFYYISGKKT